MPAESFWATDTVTVIQYVIMIVIAITAFVSNFQKKAGAKYGFLALSITALVVYCYMGYMRQSAAAIFCGIPAARGGNHPDSRQLCRL